MIDNQGTGEVQVNLEQNKAIQGFWDNTSDWYMKNIELYSYQSWVYCAALSNLKDKDRVLEVACGPGKHSTTLAMHFLKRGGVLVSCDFSKNMIDKLQARYQSDDNDYTLVKDNKFVAEADRDFTEFSDDTCTKLKHQCDLEAIVKSQEPFRKLVYGCLANNELLPFGDESFGAYIANLSVHIVANPLNQVKEAYRVLKMNSIAVFTVWGAREESLFFSLVDMVLEKYLTAEQLAEHKKAKTMFHIYDDKGVKFKADLESVGFKGIKIFEAAQHLMYLTGAQLIKDSTSQLLGPLKKFGITDEATHASFLADCEK